MEPHLHANPRPPVRGRLDPRRRSTEDRLERLTDVEDLLADVGRHFHRQIAESPTQLRFLSGEDDEDRFSRRQNDRPGLRVVHAKEVAEVVVVHDHQSGELVLDHQLLRPANPVPVDVDHHPALHREVRSVRARHRASSMTGPPPRRWVRRPRRETRGQPRCGSRSVRKLVRPQNPGTVDSLHPRQLLADRYPPPHAQRGRRRSARPSGACSATRVEHTLRTTRTGYDQHGAGRAPRGGPGSPGRRLPGRRGP